MNSLLNDQFLPVTNSWGFLECPFGDVSAETLRWLSELDPHTNVRRFNATLAGALAELEPLNIRKTLLASTDSSWTAVFANAGVSGPQAEIGYLSRCLGCRGLLVTCVADTFNEGSGCGQYGGVQFNLYSSSISPGEVLNEVRSVAAVNDGGKWVFVNQGPPQDFEHPERYTARRIRDRMNDELLEQYCRALGIRLFEANFYGPEFSLIGAVTDLPCDFSGETFQDVQSRLGTSQ